MSIIEKAAGRLAQKSMENLARVAPVSSAPAPVSLHIPVEHIRRAREAESRAGSSANTARYHIDIERLHAAGMVTPNGERTPIAEEFRFIKRSLISAALRRDERSGRHANLIMVTSALPGEGKTFCSINLAMSIAMEMDHTVLLVDADVARPSVLSTLGIEAHVGLMDLLRDDALDVSDVLVKTDVAALSILPSGTSQKNATELLASQSMKLLLEQVAARYADRIVIFDSPPVLMTSEARVLAEQMGQIVMVVEAERTTQNAVKDALRRLGACDNVSLLYNKGRDFAEHGSYGYYSK